MRDAHRHPAVGLAVVLAVLCSVVLIKAQSSHALFERARLLEDSNQDLAEAISLYGQVVDQTNEDRGPGGHGAAP